MMPADGLAVSYQAMTAADMTAVMHLERTSMAYPLRETQLRHMWTSAAPYGWRVLQLRRGVAAHGVLAYCGYLLQGDEAHVLRLGCWPQVQGRRLGRWLMLNVLRELQADQCRQVHLEVGRSNQRARRLYQRLGFRQVGCRRHYYPDQEDALLLSLAIKPVGRKGGQFDRLYGQTRRELCRYRNFPDPGLSVRALDMQDPNIQEKPRTA